MQTIFIKIESQIQVFVLFKLHPLTRVPLCYCITYMYIFMFTRIWFHNKTKKLESLYLIDLFKMRQLNS